MPVAPQLAPVSTRGPIGWARANLFNSVGNTILTILFGALAVLAIYGFVKFALVDATWVGADRDACLPKGGQAAGACWPMITERLAYFTYGSYPIDQRWRVDIVFALGAIGLLWVLWLDAPRKDLAAGYFFVIFPVAAFFLLYGLPAIGLQKVDSDLWGGILVTLVISSAGIVAALPLGILLALGRRSKLPIVSIFSTLFIEIARGVPLITVLFVAKVMLGYFVPERFDPTLMVKALILVALFSAAYMAEVVRGGLQSIPKGQQEGASSLGLGYWQSMRLIILPQALAHHHSGHRQHLHRRLQGHVARADHRHVRFPRHHPDRDLGRQMGDARERADRLSLRRPVLLGLLLRHVALFARGRDAALRRS